MTDMTFTSGRDSSHGVKGVHKKKWDTLSSAKYTNRDQLAIAAALLSGGIAGVIVLVLYLMMLEGIFLY